MSVLLLVFGGLPLLLWGTCMRLTFGLHATWTVNSVTHMWGGRRFKTRDDSRNNCWVALLTFGEGWHNNHHAHPTSARHGLAWYEFDFSWIQISILKFLGIAKAVRVAKVHTAQSPSAKPRSSRPECWTCGHSRPRETFSFRYTLEVWLSPAAAGPSHSSSRSASA